MNFRREMLEGKDLQMLSEPKLQQEKDDLRPYTSKRGRKSTKEDLSRKKSKQHMDKGSKSRITLFQEPNIIGVIKVQRIHWLGHIMRLPQNRIPRRLLESEAEGRKRRGRSRTKWKAQVEEDAEKIRICNANSLEFDTHQGLIGLVSMIEECGRIRNSTVASSSKTGLSADSDAP
ncbi:hypothetical protein ILUMI_11815 [Ignelater luminosus]|uniref:Uncharacterized protein n=1 Tax=Ignelater luminosus TaxID=2038154 RepID=A0A8K0GCD7_IGNLU|nr:hypothetical protein ILUMI_11815 [Ignelater luminosus]